MGAFDEAWDEVASEEGEPVSSFDSAWQEVEQEESPKSYDDLAIGALKGIAKAGTDVVTAPADLLYRGGNYLIDALTGQDTDIKGGYPSDYVSKFLEYISEGSGNKTAEDISHIAGNLATVIAAPSQVKNIASKVPILSKLAQGEGALAKTADVVTKGLGYATEGAAYGALGNPKSENLAEQVAIGAALNTAIPALFGTAKAGLSKILPSRGAQITAKEITDEIRNIAPNALKENFSPADRALTAAKALESKGVAAKEAASKLFKDLPNQTVVLDDAFSSTRKFAEEVAGPITPKTSTGTLINYIEQIKPKDQIINEPASRILDEFGNPIRAAKTTIIPGGPTKASLPEVQNIVRDIGAVGRGASGVDRAILGRAKEEILSATKASVDDKAWKAFQHARSNWAKMLTTYEKGAIGKVRKSLTDPNTGLNTFQKVLLNDPKGARQLAKVMLPNEIENAQHLLLSDLLRKQPVTWARRITEKMDSYNAIFGAEPTQNLLRMVGRDGSIGSKLLQDNNGLKTLLARVILKSAGGAAVGGYFGGGEGALLGGLAGAGSAVPKGLQVSRVQSLLMQAAAGSDDALRILNSPAKSTSMPDAIGRLADILASSITREDNPELEKQSQNLELPEQSQKNIGIQDDDNKDSVIPELFSRKNMEDTKPTALEVDQDVAPLVEAVIQQESGGNAKAVSDKGAQGLMQVMPATAREIADELGIEDYDLKDPDTNRLFGTYYLKKLLDQFGGDEELALTAYHSGPARVEKLLKLTGGSRLEDIIDLLGPVGQRYARETLARKTTMV